jgi:hypothetical protein
MGYQPPLHQLAILSTGWAAFFHSVPNGVLLGFVVDHCTFSLFWFLAVFPWT